MYSSYRGINSSTGIIQHLKREKRGNSTLHAVSRWERTIQLESTLGLMLPGNTLEIQPVFQRTALQRCMKLFLLFSLENVYLPTLFPLHTSISISGVRPNFPIKQDDILSIIRSLWCMTSKLGGYVPCTADEQNITALYSRDLFAEAYLSCHFPLFAVVFAIRGRTSCIWNHLD